MENYDYLQERVTRLRRSISTLEWDLGFIKNEDVKNLKTKILDKYKKELEQLSRKAS